MWNNCFLVTVVFMWNSCLSVSDFSLRVCVCVGGGGACVRACMREWREGERERERERETERQRDRERERAFKPVAETETNSRTQSISKY